METLHEQKRIICTCGEPCSQDRGFLVPVLTVIKLVVEIVNKAANCNGKLQIQISIAR